MYGCGCDARTAKVEYMSRILKNEKCNDMFQKGCLHFNDTATTFVEPV